MAVTIEELYRNYGILADAKDNLSPVLKPHKHIESTHYMFLIILKARF